MHLRISTTHRSNKDYSYPQLVQSYRRPSDGMPAVKVVANLGPLSQQEIDNLRTALAASREGKSVIVVPQGAMDAIARSFPSQPVLANLRYLDVAVALETWKSLALDSLLGELMPIGDSEVAAAAVTTALVLHRSTDPGSKLHAQRWFPATALPELLGIAPAQFNNTRLHRVLQELDEVSDDLQDRLPSLYQRRDGCFLSLFLDVTDTWFVGEGPSLAEMGKTKEGLYCKKISIALLCSERGLPLRWRLFPGRDHDSQTMGEVLSAVQGLDWAQEVPVVVDRAMGNSAGVRKLKSTGLRFLTALTRNEFDTFTDRIPHAAFADLKVDQSETVCRQAMVKARKTALEAGLTRVDDSLYVLDLGILSPCDVSTKGMPKVSVVSPEVGDKLDYCLRVGQELRVELDAGRSSCYLDVGQKRGWTKAKVYSYVLLTKLTEEIQQVVREGRATGLSINDLRKIARLTEPAAQRTEFARLLERATTSPEYRKARKIPGHAPVERRTESEGEELRVRAVVYFNPEMFVTQRSHAQKKLEEIEAFLLELNTRLSTPQSRRNMASVAGEVSAKLHRLELADCFDIQIEERPIADRARWYVELKLKADMWARHRRYDGFSLLVGHPELVQSAFELARLYRAKDAVEKDFEDIKSVIHIRPVRHRTDPKVRAHVTLCMLALLVNRTIERKLAALGHTGMTAKAAFEILKSCHLNRLVADPNQPTAYTITRPSPDQVAILSALGLERLVRDQEVVGQLTACRE